MDSLVGADVAEHEHGRGGRDRTFGDGADDRIDGPALDDARHDSPRRGPAAWFDAAAAKVAAVPVSGWITLVVVAASVVLVTSVLAPEWIRRDTIPTGGDMGAHVWGPAYLRDHLLPHGRLVGWTPDWFA